GCPKEWRGRSESPLLASQEAKYLQSKDQREVIDASRWSFYVAGISRLRARLKDFAVASGTLSQHHLLELNITETKAPIPASRRALRAP
ncbi:MAG: hypothetical protein IKK21_10605, partial [Clostridia bacterium]|nr:hypothetical protein [Clostridia bacterium]